MKREKVDKADKLDVHAFLFSSKNCSNKRKNRSSASKTPTTLSFLWLKSLTIQYITNSTNSTSRTSSRITIFHSLIPKIYPQYRISNHLQPPKSQVYSKPMTKKALTNTKRSQRIQSPTIVK